MSTTLFLLPLLLGTATGACTKSVLAPSEAGAGRTVRGTITAADGVTPIASVLVEVLPAGTPATTTNAQGRYLLSGVPTGAQQLRARRGNFEAVFTVAVSDTAAVEAAPAALQPVGKLGYVRGAYDSIETIIRDRLGNPIEELQPNDLLSPTRLSEYRMIFVNCGFASIEAEAQVGQAAQRLGDWVRSGGSLYASDFALSYLSAIVQDDVLAIEYSPVQTVAASVTDSDLQTFIASSSIQVRYNAAGWYGLRQISSRPRVLIRGSYQTSEGPVQDRPLAIVLTEGAGRVVYTTFHNSAAATADQIAVLRYYVYVE